jgi:hypothetical protein
MSFAAAIMTPLALALPAPASGDAAAIFAGEPVAAPMVAEHEEAPSMATSERPAKVPSAGWTLHFEQVQFEPQAANQVRIEQRVTIRINPRNESTQQSMFAELPDREIGPRFVERKIGECVKVSQISGVQTDVGNRLLLFMSDRTIVSAMLERACRARDFYSGFYLAKSKDGKLCVARDSLQSRSGANCKITRIRELVEVEN